MCYVLSISCWFSLTSFGRFSIWYIRSFIFFYGHSGSFQFFSAVFLISPLTQCFPAFFTSWYTHWGMCGAPKGLLLPHPLPAAPPPPAPDPKGLYLGTAWSCLGNTSILRHTSVTLWVNQYLLSISEPSTALWTGWKLRKNKTQMAFFFFPQGLSNWGDKNMFMK